MELTRELFVVPNGKEFILYAPLENSLMEVNPQTLTLLKKIKSGVYNGEQPDVIEELKKRRIIVEQLDVERHCCSQKQNDSKFNPTSVTLFPTSDCNLRCVYCYGSGGENSYFMDWNVAKKAIDFVFENAYLNKQKDEKNNKTHVGFHGGGEPLFYWSIVKRAVEYSKEKAEKEGIDLGISSATNGVLDAIKLEFIINNFSNISLSLDGTEDIQNYQRPMCGNKPSFDRVMKTVNFFEDKKFKYGIRSTITNYNVERMVEMLDFFTSVTSLKSFHFEPVFECGRCKTTGTHEPNPKVFLKKMIELKEYALEKGVEIYYSGGRCGGAVHYFCGAMGRNFCVTPKGDITSCYEVSLPNDPRGKIFYYGKIKKEIRLFNRKRQHLMSRVVENMPHCENCFAKFNCAGDCPAKVYAKTGDIFDSSENTRCRINQGILRYDLNQMLKKGEKHE